MNELDKIKQKIKYLIAIRSNSNNNSEVQNLCNILLTDLYNKKFELLKGLKNANN